MANRSTSQSTCTLEVNTLRSKLPLIAPLSGARKLTTACSAGAKTGDFRLSLAIFAWAQRPGRFRLGSRPATSSVSIGARGKGATQEGSCRCRRHEIQMLLRRFHVRFQAMRIYRSTLRAASRFTAEPSRGTLILVLRITTSDTTSPEGPGKIFAPFTVRVLD